MYKLMYLLKRKEDFSLDQFIEYYENNHAKIGEKIFNGYAIRYVRRYLHPLESDPVAQEAPRCQFDVAMECWFQSREDFEAVVAISSEPAMLKIILEDEARFIDRTQRAAFVVEEYESKLEPLGRN
jgi:hypothetical protein